jgi:hypothetical protein
VNEGGGKEFEEKFFGKRKFTKKFFFFKKFVKKFIAVLIKKRSHEP